MSKYKISIILPCYNGGEYLKESLHSCLNQNYDNVEVIFVDNESTDDSLKVAQKFKIAYSNLLISTAPNIHKFSASEPVTEALTLISGDYFTVVGADDILTIDYISNVVKRIESLEEEVLCIQSAIHRLFPNGGGDLVGYSYNNVDELKNQLLLHCCVNTPTVFYKKTLYDRGLLTWKTKEYLGAEDYDMYCQLADKNIFIHTCNEWLGYFYRIHEGQCTWGMVEESKKGNNFDQKIKSFWKKRWKK